jgi:2-polyprenyl-6-methoxyphenol hydroxylase-like FAD-dependent oxidoreductase
VNARASYARAGTGERWLAIGDARIAPDPLSGQGIIWAFDDAISVMDLLRRMAWHDLAREMDARTLRDVAAYRVERSRVYSSEQRFKDDVFWTGSGPALPVAPRISSARELSSHGDGELI